MSEKIPMTEEGFESLKKELRRLIEVERRKIIKEIEEARSHGDLSENAEYDAAKEKQALLEKKIIEIEKKIVSAQVIDTTGIDLKTVAFGAEVLLQDQDSAEEIKYRIVGADEANVNAGKISINAPLSRALIGKYVGEIVQVKIPAGVKKYKILSIHF